MKPESTAKQPKMLKRIQLRYALGLLSVAILLFGWYYLRDLIGKGIDLGSPDSAGWIVALKQTDSGQQVVILKPDDTMLERPDYPAGARDQDPDVAKRRWARLLRFRFGRVSNSLQIYRWNPGNGVSQRSTGRLAKANPVFQEDGINPGPYTILMVKAGVVVEFNPNDGRAHQIVPVEGKTPTTAAGDDPGSMGTQFGSEYEHLGSSFREAHWCKNRKYVAGIMHGDEGETLVVVCLEPGSTQGALDDGLPHGIVKGGHIDMAVDPKSGNVVYSVDDFRFVDPKDVPANMIKNGKIVKPFRNILGLLDPDDQSKSGAIVLSADVKSSFGEPQVSPDGTRVVFVAGTDTKDGFKPVGIIVAPFALGGGKSGSVLTAGEASSPSWSRMPSRSCSSPPARVVPGIIEGDFRFRGRSNLRFSPPAAGSFQFTPFQPDDR